METIILTITDEHRAKAIDAYVNRGEFLVESCLIAQAIKEKIPSTKFISVTNCNAYIEGKPYSLDSKGQYVAQLTLVQWNELALPVNVELTKEWW